jgi:hypothetical protein
MSRPPGVLKGGSIRSCWTKTRMTVRHDPRQLSQATVAIDPRVRVWLFFLQKPTYSMPTTPKSNRPAAQRKAPTKVSTRPHEPGRRWRFQKDSCKVQRQTGCLGGRCPAGVSQPRWKSTRLDDTENKPAGFPAKRLAHGYYTVCRRGSQIAKVAIAADRGPGALWPGYRPTDDWTFTRRPTTATSLKGSHREQT